MTSMDKLKMHSPDLSQENIAKLRELFPGCVTEAHDGATGELRLAVDFDQLRQELGDHIVEGPQERYRLDWPGKREALAVANAPITKILRPCFEESLDFKTTKNLFIEGDNLETLKLLQNTYLGKIKVIYIDPPYNTGNNFIYKDNFTEHRKNFLERTAQVDKDNNQLVANPMTNGRFHSDWLSMMYPRLRLARNFLSDDGVIFISIDDREEANLKLIADEIFGKECFINKLIWKKANKPLNTSKYGFSKNTESIFMLGKNPEIMIEKVALSQEHAKTYKNPDNDPRGEWTKVPLFLRTNSNPEKELRMPWDGSLRTEKWFVSQGTLEELYKEKRIIRTKKQIYKKIYLSKNEGRKPLNILDNEAVGFARNGTEDLKALDLEIEFPKPVQLIKYLLERIKDTDDEIVLDFFSGSCTTAHAVLDLNKKDGRNRKFICIQFPETCLNDEKALKTGFKTIADIGKERIRRAGNKSLEGDYHPNWNRDIGFRVLKVDTSNMEEVFYRPDDLTKDNLQRTIDNVKPGRTVEDLLFQVLVDWGMDLTLPIRHETVQGKTVFFVDNNTLVACFDRGVTEDLVRELASHRPLRVVFRDNGFISDAMKINVGQVFRQLSPTTEVKSI